MIVADLVCCNCNNSAVVVVAVEGDMIHLALNRKDLIE
jgi:hypothetical protein